MSDDGGGSNNSDSTTRQEPWEPTKGYLKRLLPDVQSQIVDRPLEFYPGQTYADFAPETEQALGLQASRALGGSPLVGAAQGEALSTIGGDYLGDNPYFDAMYDMLERRVGQTVGRQAALSGRGMGTAEGQVMAREISDAMLPYMFQDYGNERSRMMGMVGAAPNLADYDYRDIAALGEVGAQREDLTQRIIDEAVRRHEFEQYEPQSRLGYAAELFGGIGGMGGVSQTHAGGRSGDSSNDFALRMVGK